MSTPTKEQAVKAYQTADAAGKKLLIGLWGEETFASKLRLPISVEEAFKGMKLNLKKDIPFPEPKHLRQEVANARFMLEVIAEYMQNGHVFNWNDPNEKKYYGVFNMAGFGFSVTAYVITYTDTIVGSRLSFQTPEQTEHFCKQFLDLHKLVLTNKK